MPLVYLSLGSNLGNREDYLTKARQTIQKEFSSSRFSKIYETEPIDLLNQPWFLNQVAEFMTDRTPESLLEWAHQLEKEQNRQREIPKGPRTLDVDLLLYGALIQKDGDPVLPHPRLTQRRHVLTPLAELAPGLRIPSTSLTVQEALTQVNDFSQVRIHADT
jgi:2-amino-4-hydroxy-6-hydroxymethyldihydropteridine diphosphokinase